VVVDESQDFHNEEWKLIRALVPAGANDLFLVGDAHQRIYGRKVVVLSRCGIATQGRSSTLRINYRTTEQIRAWAVAMLEGMAVDDLDGEADEGKGYMSLLSGPKPECHRFLSAADEQEFLGKTLKALVKDRPAEEICVVARTAKLIKDDYQALLKSLGIEHVVLDRTREGTSGGVRLATMHRVKGLEFPVMILAGVNSKVMPLRIAAVESDPTAKKEHEDRERSLLFVAATRARDQLIVTSWGTPSPFLPICPKCGGPLLEKKVVVIGQAQTHHRDRWCPACRSAKGKLLEIWIAFKTDPNTLERRIAFKTDPNTLKRNRTHKRNRQWWAIKRYACKLFRHWPFDENTMKELLDWLRYQHGKSDVLATETSEVVKLLKAAARLRKKPDVPTPAPATTAPAPAVSPEDGPRVVLRGRDEGPIVLKKTKGNLTTAQYDVVKALLDAGEAGLTKDKLDRKSGHGDARKILRRVADSDPDWKAVIQFGGRPGGRYRIIG
jgi:hypothetical protein